MRIQRCPPTPVPHKHTSIHFKDSNSQTGWEGRNTDEDEFKRELHLYYMDCSDLEEQAEGRAGKLQKLSCPLPNPEPL